MTDNRRDPEHLLAHTEWVRQLARSLVRDEATADDLAQDTMTAALHRPPPRTDNVRGWLGTIVRRTASRRRRGDERRKRREQDVARAEAIAGVDQTYQRISLQRDLAAHVLALDEPYRRAITLRYFDDLPPKAIAERLGLPVHTVKTHLQRGLHKLRQRLDADHGSRMAWVAILLPWVDASTATIVTTAAEGSVKAAVAAGTLGFAMKLFATSLGALLVAALAFWLWPRTLEFEGEDPVDNPTTIATANANGSGGGSSASSPERAARREADRESTPKPDPERESIERASAGYAGQVVDRFNQPIAEVAVRRIGRYVVRWQGGDIGWISNLNESLRILPAQEDRLRTDVDAATRFFERFEHPAEWRATVLGESIPDREIDTAADGRFVFEGITKAAVDVVEPGWATLIAGTARNEGERVWIACKVARVSGRVLDENGEPLANAVVESRWQPEDAIAQWPESFHARSKLQEPRTRTDNDGRYVLRRVPVVPGATVVAQAAGRDAIERRAPDRDTTGFDLRAASTRPNAEVTVQGRVLDDAGKPVADATICFFSEYAKTDGNGEFEVAVNAPPPRAALTAFKAGYRPAQLNRFGERVVRDPNLGRGITLTLPGPPLKLQGLVLDPDGRPCPGACINVIDDTVLDFSMTNLEARSGARKRFVQTDDSGRFELGGLDDRRYRLRVWHPQRRMIAVTDPIHPMRGPQTIRFSSEDRFEHVRGRVVDATGEPLAGCSVRLMIHYHVNKSGAGTMNMAGIPITTDADGEFEMQGVPRRHVFLSFKSPTDDRVLLPVERIATNGTVVVTLPAAAHVRVMTSAKDSIDAVRLLDAKGRALPIRRVGTTRAADDETTLTLRGGDLPLIAVDPSARHAVGLRQGREIARVALELGPGSHQYARLSPR